MDHEVLLFRAGPSRRGVKGVSYPGPRSVGGAPRSLRMIFLSPFMGNTKADNSKFLNYFALLNDICTAAVPRQNALNADKAIFGK